MACCAPSRPAGSATANAPAIQTGKRLISATAVEIPGGTSLLGTHAPQIKDDGEDPQRPTKIKPFLMDASTVTNADFAVFTEATGYVTEAEKFGWSFVFWSDVSDEIEESQGIKGLEWWRRIDGTDWRNVNGPSAAIQLQRESTAPPDHPVVHISWNDAQAYAAWAGGRLPTEAEWEHAARGGLGDVRFPWGDAEPDDTKHLPCNIWQGHFPEENTCADGYKTTAPTQSFAPNGYGLYNMVGNVWEWTNEPFKIKSLKKHVKKRLSGMKGYKLSKGGSFLCHKSYCYRYRIAARSGNSPESTTTHQGFRMAWDI